MTKKTTEKTALKAGDAVKIKDVPRTRAMGIAGKEGVILRQGPIKDHSSFIVKVNLGNTKAVHNRILNAEDLELAEA